MTGLRVLSWNLQWRLEADDRPQRWQTILETLAKADADCWCLQEVSDGLSAAMRRRFPNWAVVCAARDGDASGSEQTCCWWNTARMTVHAHGRRWFGAHPHHPSRDRDAAYPRVMTWIRARWRRQWLWLASFHCDHRGRQARIVAAQQLAAMARAAGEAALLGGDLNAPPRSRPWAHLVAAGFRDAARVCGSSAATWSDPWGLLRRRIDFLFADRCWHIAACDLVPLRGRRRRPSDHHPLLTEVVPCCG